MGDLCFLIYVEIVLGWVEYGTLYFGSDYDTGPVINFPHFGRTVLGASYHTLQSFNCMPAFLADPQTMYATQPNTHATEPAGSHHTPFQRVSSLVAIGI